MAENLGSPGCTTPWSGQSPTSVKRAYEMGTSGLRRTSIILAADALTTNRSMHLEDLIQRRDAAGRQRTNSMPPCASVLTETTPLPRSSR